MKLILITTPTYYVEEDQILTALFEEGLDILHLRKPQTSPVYAERLLTLLPEKYHDRIVVHDNFYLKDEYNLKGIHLNSRNPEIPANYSGHVSASCHSFEEVLAKKKETDYLFLSPIFDSISKKGYQSAFTAEELKEASRKGIIDQNIIALGGIDESTIEQAKELNFGGVALMGGLWSKFDSNSDFNYQELLSHFRKFKRLIE